MSWYQYLDTLRLSRQEFDYYASIPPMACPRCGEPLIPTPGTTENITFCRVDGWSYPRDYVRPQRL